MVVSTANVECRVTLQTRCACTLGRFAQLADCVVSKRWRSDALDHIQAGRVAEFDLSVPEGTVHVYPVVVGGSLQGLTRNKWPAFLLLPKAIFLFGLVDKLLFQPLLLPIAVSLFLVRNLWLLIELLLRIFLRT